ncbi:MAG TPA: hypothetical protein VGN83_26515 [Falsiroseomonas sp.]|jgi:hypothetical protein|nr:hypothetical protein [Falsiroseomonas sp.]
MSQSFQYKQLGETNAGWGVCGFTSSFYAMYKERHGTQKWLQNATHGYSVLYEIREYLMALQGASSPMLGEIVAFTRTFGDEFKDFTIEKYIARIERASAQEKEEEDILDNSKFGIALPPAAVADYLRRMWKAKAEVKQVDLDSLADGIVGVSRGETDDKGGRQPYLGLCHYMYRRNFNVYSWGSVFPSVAAADQWKTGGVTWRVRWLIEVKA